MTDTIVALSSGRPPAAVAIIRTSGPQALVAAAQLAGSLPSPRQVALRKLHDPADGSLLDEALLLRFDAPNSSTGEDIVEYQCHGGRAVVDGVLGALTSIDGLRAALPGEFTRRAVANGRIDFTEAEGLADLLDAETKIQRRAALKLAGGALSRQIDLWQSRILDLSAQAEVAIDYVGDEDETEADVGGLVDLAVALAGELQAWLARPRIEVLRDGVRVVVAGPPNSGKSSLVNALAGSDRVIVTDVPGTTRDAIEVPLSVDGLPLLLVDTAGLRATEDLVEAQGIERSNAEVSRAAILLWLGAWEDAPQHKGLVRVQSKVDLVGREPPIRDQQPDIAVSALTGHNLSALLSLIAAKSKSLLPNEDGVALNRRQAKLVEEAAELLQSIPPELLLLAETLRAVRHRFDLLTGRASIEEALDVLFARFCLGK